MSGKKKLEYIRIVGKEYEIKKAHPLLLDDKETWGYIDYAECIIWIDSELSPQMQRYTLMHETFHAILYEMGNDLHKDEQFTEAISNIMCQVIKDNYDRLVLL